MRTIAGSLAGTVAGILLLGPAASSADPTGRCTHESWMVEGMPLTATLCAPTAAVAPAGHVEVAESCARNGATITRALDTVALDAVGSSKQLHLTIAYHAGAAAVEHALLLPGAVVLK
jgi:hypothetical protein